MDDTTSFSYPPIDPTTFDLIIVGTGLPESILAAAASSSGKTVLHLDPNPFYGSHFSSLPLSDLPSFLLSHSPSHLSDAVSLPLDDLTTPSQSDALLIPVDLTTRPIYSHIDISSPSPDLLANSRKFNLDLAGPRVLFCADSAVDLLLKSGANQYVEFKNVDGNYVYGGDGTLSSVPDSRSAVFKDTSLGLADKNRLGSFFKLIEGHLKEVGLKDGGGGRVSEEDLERPFVEFLDKMRLPAKIKSIIIYAIAMADYDQDNLEGCKSVLKTKDGINRLALYHSSVGRFHNALGALIYPIYGHGELCQAFCRRAAVKGCLYVLRMPVKALLVDKEGSCKGAKLASGQDLFSNEIVLGPSFMTLASSANSSPDFPQAKLFDVGRGVGGKVARGICITNSSLKTDFSTCLVVYPPKSLYSEQVTSIRVLQIGSNLAVCPSGMFVVYLSTLCDDAIQGKKSLNAAINTMFSVPISEIPENSSNTTSENTEVKPTLLWSALYVQEMTTGSYDSLCFTPMPDGNLNYSDLLDATKQLFHKMFPEEKFFPETTFSQLDDDDGDLASPNSDSLDS